MRTRLVATATFSALAALTVSSGVTSAPLTLDAPAASGSLVAAIRLNPPKPTSPTARVVQLVNDARIANGLAPLQVDARLQQAAQLHSEDQARTGVMSHTGSDGSNAGQRITRAGFAWRAYAENVAYGQLTADEVVAAWMASEGHRRNNLSANTHVGVGLAHRGATPYWTLVFATPR